MLLIHALFGQFHGNCHVLNANDYITKITWYLYDANGYVKSFIKLVLTATNKPDCLIFYAIIIHIITLCHGIVLALWTFCVGLPNYFAVITCCRSKPLTNSIVFRIIQFDLYTQKTFHIQRKCQAA